MAIKKKKEISYRWSWIIKNWIMDVKQIIFFLFLISFPQFPYGIHTPKNVKRLFYLKVLFCRVNNGE